MDYKPKDQVLPVKSCARCGDDHEKVIFRLFELGPRQAPYTHWGWCPLTHEPILMEVRHGADPV